MTVVGNVQAQSTTGGIWLVNDGVLLHRSVVQAGGTVDITAMSPITITKSINAAGDITLTSTHDADRGDMVASAGGSIDSTNGVGVPASGRQLHPGSRREHRGRGFDHDYRRLRQP